MKKNFILFLLITAYTYSNETVIKEYQDEKQNITWYIPVFDIEDSFDKPKVYFYVGVDNSNQGVAIVMKLDIFGGFGRITNVTFSDDNYSSYDIEIKPEFGHIESTPDGQINKVTILLDRVTAASIFVLDNENLKLTAYYNSDYNPIYEIKLSDIEKEGIKLIFKKYYDLRRKNHIEEATENDW
ncbi:hypothetical protein [Brachyspira intermedia]|uniref:hypothetical protein n=1 Tax=Brachyspira intermedia TaxID=84377 RepID=UPI0030059C0D